MIESARAGPDWLSSIESPPRASEPSTRIVLPVSSEPLPSSACLASSGIPSWVWALIMNSTSDSSSQPAIASRTHLTTRPTVIWPGSRGSRGRPSLWRERRRLSESRSPVPASGRRRER